MYQWRSIRRFGAYSLVGGGTLLFDLLLLAGLTSILHVPYYISTPISFLIAVSINYAISRKYVFKGTKRRVHHGYAYFAGISIIAALFITVAVAVLVTYIGIPFLIARVLVAAVVGIANYLLNLYLNFRVAGIHL
jgi:putative flippase GtrA